MQALLVLFDRLPYWLLGCYGNLAAKTRGFDCLAACGTTFDLCFASDPASGGLLPGLTDALSRLASRQTALRIVAQSGSTGAAQLSNAFEGSCYSTIADGGELLADRVEAAIESLSATGRSEDAVLTIVSLTGFPLECPADLAPLTHQVLSEADAVVSRLLQRSVAAGGHAQHLLLVTAATGVHWNTEVGRPNETPLRNPFIHVPLLGRIASSADEGVRSNALVTHGDVLATLLTWFGGEEAVSGDHRTLWPPADGTEHLEWDAIVIRGPDGHVGLRTPQWYLTSQRGIDRPLADQRSGLVDSAALFKKPDDLWDVLDVSLESPQIVEDLVEKLIEALANDPRQSGVA